MPELYRPTLPVHVAARLYADRICAHCGHTVVAKDGSPTGYTHADEWQGIRCPRRITGATPISDEALERVVAIIREDPCGWCATKGGPCAIHGERGRPQTTREDA